MMRTSQSNDSATLPSMMRALGVIAAIVTLTAGGCGDSKPEPSSSAPVASSNTATLVETRSTSKTIVPKFRMLGKESGFEFERHDDINGQRRLIEANGGGIAVFDFDHDGWTDIFMTNGCKLPLSLNDRTTPSELFRNQSEMRFERATSGSRLNQFGYATGCAVGDYDSDGFDDLYVAAFGPNTLWRNNGDGSFTEITHETSTAVPQWSTSTAFADLNLDGLLDLYVVNYVDESDEHPRRCPNPASPDGFEQCPPALFEGVDDVVLLNDGQGGFLDVTERTKVAGLKGKGLGLVIADMDHDLFPEIYVANDGEANFLFVVNQESRALRHSATDTEPWVPVFEERAAASGLAFNEAGFAQASMGIAFGDVDRNGWPDLFVTNFFGDTNTLYLNRGKLAFEDATRASGLGAPSRDRLGFGTMFFDANNDGWLDVMVANGHVDDREWQDRNEPYRQRPLLQVNQGDGTFIDVSDLAGEYFQQTWLGRALAVSDFDHDGRQDVVVSHQKSGAVILKNETQTRDHSAHITLVGVKSVRSEIGSRIDVIGTRRTAIRHSVASAGFQTSHSVGVTVNCRLDERLSVRVTWPFGNIQDNERLSPGRWVIIEGTETVSIPR